MELLYLDFDGVLHPENVYIHRKRGIYLDAPGKALFEWMPVLEELVAPHPALKIVLSTSWVRERSYSFAKRQLSPRLQERVIGATFHHRYMRQDEFALLSRGEQIGQDVITASPNHGAHSMMTRLDGRSGVGVT